MARFIEWTSGDIEQMKVAFLQGKTIKVIAKQLGRTPTALNKALSRFGIRQSRKQEKIIARPYVDWRRYLIPENNSTCLDTEAILLPTAAKVKNNFLINRDGARATDPRWVPL